MTDQQQTDNDNLAAIMDYYESARKADLATDPDPHSHVCVALAACAQAISNRLAEIRDAITAKRS